MVAVTSVGEQIPEAALKEIIGKERQQRGLMCEIPVKRNAASRGHEASLQFTGWLAASHCVPAPPDGFQWSLCLVQRE